jgi:1-acyl-sn-glycerol-3-phosphate acyltransferase
MSNEHTGRSRRAWAAYSIIAMVFGEGLLVMLCILWLPFALVLHPLLPRRLGARVGRRAITIAARAYLRCLTVCCACRFDLSAVDALRHEHPLILVANHPSLIDILLLVSRFPNAVCIMKRSLMRNVLFGAATRLAGYVPNYGPFELVLRACEELRQGGQLIIFPEGTRTKSFPLDPCGQSAALIAERAGVVVQTLVIGFSSPYLGKSWPLWRRPELPLAFWIRLGRRFAPSRDTRTLTREIESTLRSSLGAAVPERAPEPSQAQPDAVI